jgi:hypothetical protein
VAAQLGLTTQTVGDAKPDPLPSPVSPEPAGLDRILRPGVAQSIADLIADLFGVMAVITDMEGHPITNVANPCGYYDAIANQPGAVEACMSQWRLFADEPHVAPRWVRTHLGFLCARTFVWVDLKPVGMIVVGGVTPTAWPPTPDQIAEIAGEVGVRTEIILDAVDETWDIEADGRRKILRLLPQFGDLVSQLASARRQVVIKLSEPTP